MSRLEIQHLKRVCHIEHSRHRSTVNFLAHLAAGLVGSCHLSTKPALDLHPRALSAA